MLHRGEYEKLRCNYEMRLLNESHIVLDCIGSSVLGQTAAKKFNRGADILSIGSLMEPVDERSRPFITPHEQSNLLMIADKRETGFCRVPTDLLTSQISEPARTPVDC